ncbi:MAG: hypothetical protein QG582_920, partial [Candidatus Thermoplasmatota archaeon]|nr:hypothetical protein [Candidatus Thermoplasmatota archaeon]
MTPALGRPRIVSSAGAKAVPVLSIPEAVPVVLSDDRRPCFTSTWLERAIGNKRHVLTSYAVNGVPVTISSADEETSARYEVHPPEYELSPALVKIVAEVIHEITSSPPEGLDLGSLSVLRPFIKAMAKDKVHRRLAPRRADSMGSGLSRDVDYLAELVSKYTAGYGVLETLFEDRAVQDIYINAPSGQTPVHVVLRSDVLERVGQKCRTNVFVGRDDL